MTYPREVRSAVVEAYLTPGRSPASVCAEFDVSPGIVRLWVRAAGGAVRQHGGARQKSTKDSGGRDVDSQPPPTKPAPQEGASHG